VFDRVGRLDEDFFLNQEDLEFCLRLRLAGYHLVVAGDAYVHHLGGGSKLSLDPARQLALHSEATRVLLQKLAARFGGAVPPLESLWGDDVVGGERLSSTR
jgi:GT2 family glycosyltransferase